MNAKLYVEILLLELVQECRSVLPWSWLHLSTWTARLHTWQSWLKIGLLPTAVNSLVKMNGLRTRLTYHVWGAMLERYKAFQPKPENIDELKKVLQLIWDQLPQDSNELPEDFGLVWKLVMDTSNKRWNELSDCGICNNSKCFLTMKITSCCWLLRAELKIWHRIFIQP